MTGIRYITKEDKEYWYSLDKHLPQDEYDKKVRDGQGYIISADEKSVGILRYNMFWDNTPFCTMIYIGEAFRNKGYGKALMQYWHDDMKKKGYGIVLTSTQVNEDAQHFYRALGYKDCGSLIMDIEGYEQPMEMFMIKKI